MTRDEKVAALKEAAAKFKENQEACDLAYATEEGLKIVCRNQATKVYEEKVNEVLKS